MRTSRRRFLATSAFAVPAVMATARTAMPEKTTFIHHVFFWLNNPSNKEDKARQDSYQQDPIHLKFIEECSSLWSKVQVYDSEDVVA